MGGVLTSGRTGGNLVDPATREHSVGQRISEEADSEYVDTQMMSIDVAIGLRAIPAAFYGQGVALAPDRVTLLGITFDDLTMAEAIDLIVRRAAGSNLHNSASLTPTASILHAATQRTMDPESSRPGSGRPASD